MNEISETQLRIAAMDIAIKYLNSHPDNEDTPVGLAAEIYEFIKGETK